ncbi:hypothetical protein JTB14_013339 [Gonioctena quinquepunctata]|nr:hypothetical protein JTB14_013339 [Gonioctena quinquepunctata]
MPLQTINDITVIQNVLVKNADDKLAKRKSHNRKRRVTTSSLYLDEEPVFSDSEEEMEYMRKIFDVSDYVSPPKPPKNREVGVQCDIPEEKSPIAVIQECCSLLNPDDIVTKFTVPEKYLSDLINLCKRIKSKSNGESGEFVNENSFTTGDRTDEEKSQKMCSCSIYASSEEFIPSSQGKFPQEKDNSLHPSLVCNNMTLGKPFASDEQFYGKTPLEKKKRDTVMKTHKGNSARQSNRFRQPPKPKYLVSFPSGVKSTQKKKSINKNENTRGKIGNKKGNHKNEEVGNREKPQSTTSKRHNTRKGSPRVDVKQLNTTYMLNLDAFISKSIPKNVLRPLARNWMKPNKSVCLDEIVKPITQYASLQQEKKRRLYSPSRWLESDSFLQSLTQRSVNISKRGEEITRNMGDFEIIETGFSSADETINFGTRCIGLGSLYEISTIGCFKSSEDSDGVPQVTLNSLITNGQIVLATNNVLKIFDDTKLSNLLFTAAFDSDIVSVTVSPNYKFLIVCVESGLVNVFHMKSSEEIICIFTKCLSTTKTTEMEYIKGFYEDSSPCSMTFLMVYSSGVIFRLHVNLKESEENGGTYKVSPEEIFNMNARISSASFIYPVLLTNGTECRILNTQTKLVQSFGPIEPKTIFPLGYKYLGLDFQGNLFRICTLTMVIFPVDYDTLLEDILVINDAKRSQVFAVTKPNEVGETFIQLLDTEFSQIFSLKILYPVHLIQVNSTTDDLLFISKVTSNDAIVELRLQSVYETEPELRLTRLIRRQRFEEAEKFAKTYNINPSVILKAKAELLVDKLECSPQDVNHLIKLMDTIDDANFNLQCCARVDCSRFEDIRKILTYGTKIPVKNDVANEKRVLADLLFRFDTYMAISENKDIQSWYNFSRCNLIDELKVFLKNYEIEESILIYNRMDQKTVSDLTEDHIQEILLILNNLPMNYYQPFLPTFIPITLTHLPTTLPIFVKWLYEKIFLLEKRDRLNFPQSGIMLAENVLKLLKVEENGTLFFQRQCTLNRQSLDDLSTLIEGLRILQRLKKEFRIDIELADYFKGPEILIHTLLTSNMTPDDYDNFLEQFLYNYMLQHRFDPDEIFLEEIKILLKYDDCWVSIIEAIMKHISSVKVKLEATKEVLESAEVPWCDVIRKIAHSALQYSHSLVLEIETLLKDEQRLIVMRNPKYKIKERQIINHWELEFIIRKMLYTKEPSVVEDVYQLCKSAEDRGRANQILTEHFILMRNLDEAMAVLDKNDKQEIYACTKYLVVAVETTINTKRIRQEHKDNYYKALPLLFNRLLDSCEDSIKRNQFEERFQIIRGAYKINKYFDCTLTTYDLMFAPKRNSVLDDLLEKINENLRNGSSKIDDILADADRLALWLAMDKDEILIKLCERVGKFDVVLKVAEHLYETESNSRSLCMVAILFLKFLGHQTSSLGSCFDDSYNDMLMTTVALETTKYGNDGDDSDVFLRGLKFSQDVITKALFKAEKEDFPLLVEVMNWVDCCFYLTRQESALQTKLFRNVFNPKQTAPSLTVLNAIRNYFQVYVGYIEKLKGPDRMHLSIFNGNIPQVTQEQLQSEISSLPITIETFCREGQYLTAFKLLKTLGTAFSFVEPEDSNISAQLHSMMKSKCLPQLLHVVVSADNIDVDLLFNLLLAYPKHYLKYIEHYLQTYKRQPKKFGDIAVVGMKLVDVFYGDKAIRDVMVDAALSCKWWKKLKGVRSKIPYEEFFKAKPHARLKQLIAFNILDVGTIKNYCEDFQLDAEQYHLENLISCLINWKPEYNIVTNLDGKKSLVMLNNEDSLLLKCEGIINEIADKNSVFTLMEKILEGANFYHYEVFICIYRILENNVQLSNSRSTHILLLLFLKSYSRFSSPSQREREEWYTRFPDNQALDPLSVFRLPFSELLFTSDIWSILRPEMSLKSYRFWFDGTNILRKNLKIDDICVYAVKQVVSSKVLEENQYQDWVLYPKFENLLQEVDECVGHITNLESATSVVYHLMNNTPNGADKVNAACLSYKYASEYLKTNPDKPDVEIAYKKVKNKYYGFSAMHILHKFNLADKKYLQLVTQPEALVENLYMDERILKQAESVGFGYPDINKAVDALAQLFELKIEKIRLELLNNWLSNSSVVDLDTTTIFPPNILRQVENFENNDNLKRSTYICGSGEIEMWQAHLWKVGMNEEVGNEQKSLSFKAKALKCLCAVTDEEKIAELTDITYEQFMDYINKLTLLSELECLGVSLTIETLDQYNKKELLKRLSQIGRPLAIKSMGSICMTYFLDENRYWEFIIKHSIQLGMIAELKIYVDYLKEKFDKSYYVKAWQAIIEHAFQQPVYRTEDELEELCIKNFLMIQSCPVLFYIDFEKILQMCINLRKHEYAAVLLQYLSEDKKIMYLEEILKSDTVLNDLDNLDNKGIWGIRNIKIWLGEKTV